MRLGMLALLLWLNLTVTSRVGLAQDLIEHPLDRAKAAAVDAAVDAEMRKQGLIGVAVGVVQDGRIVLLSGYGLANRESLKPVTRQTEFNWASNSPLLPMPLRSS